MRIVKSNLRLLFISVAQIFFFLMPALANQGSEHSLKFYFDTKSAFDMALRNSKNIKFQNIDFNNLTLSKRFAERQLVFNPVLNYSTINQRQTQTNTSANSDTSVSLQSVSQSSTTSSSSASLSNQLLLPGSSASVNLQYTRNNSTNLLTNQKIELTQPLLSGRSFEISRAQIFSIDMQLKRAMIARDLSIDDLFFDFCSKYISYLEAKDRLVQATEALERSKRYLASLQHQFKAGRVPEIDVKQNISSIRQSEFDLNEAAYALRQAATTFSMLVDVEKLNDEIAISDFDQVLNSVTYSPTLLNMLNNYEKYHKRYALRLLDVENSNFALRQAQDRHLDKLDLTLSTSQESSQISQSADKRLGIMYQRNLNKDQQKLAVIQAQSELEKLTLEMAYEARERQFRFNQLARDYEKSQVSLQSLQNQFSLAKNLLMIEETKLAMGRSSRTELSLAQQRLRDIEFSLISQLYNKKRLQLNLLYEVGLLRARLLKDPNYENIE